MISRPQPPPGPFQAGTDVRNIRPWLDQLRTTVAQCQQEIARLSNAAYQQTRAPDILLPPAAWDFSAMDGAAKTLTFARGQIELHNSTTAYITPDTYTITLTGAGTWYLCAAYTYADGTATVYASAAEPVSDSLVYRKCLWVMVLAADNFVYQERRHWGNVELWAAATQTPEEQQTQECLTFVMEDWLVEMREAAELDTEVWCLLYQAVAMLDAQGDAQTIDIIKGVLGTYTGSLSAVDAGGDTMTLTVVNGIITNYEGEVDIVGLFDPTTGDSVVAKVISGKLYYRYR